MKNNFPKFREYTIGVEKNHLFGFDFFPPKEWLLPDNEALLDKSLPYLWPEIYIEKYKQTFCPATYMKNCCALANYYHLQDENGKKAVLKIIQKLQKRLLKYIYI